MDYQSSPTFLHVYQLEILLVNCQTTVTKKLGGLWTFRVEIHRAEPTGNCTCLIGAILPLRAVRFCGNDQFKSESHGQSARAVEGSVLFVSQMVMNYQVKKRLNCLNASV